MAVTSIQEKRKSIVAGALCMRICNENASPLVDLWSRFLSQFYSFDMLNMLNIANPRNALVREDFSFLRAIRQQSRAPCSILAN